MLGSPQLASLIQALAGIMVKIITILLIHIFFLDFVDE